MLLILIRFPHGDHPDVIVTPIRPDTNYDFTFEHTDGDAAFFTIVFAIIDHLEAVAGQKLTSISEIETAFPQDIISLRAIEAYVH